MKSESKEPTKYRLARRLHLRGPDQYYEYILQGWYEWEDKSEDSGLVDHVGEWRNEVTVDLDEHNP